MSFCSSCGFQNAPDASFCEECGAKLRMAVPQPSTPVPSLPAPGVRRGFATAERTESLVIQVSPDYENQKIKEMEPLGWNLQGRQEFHEEGDAYGRPSDFTNTYIVKIKVSHYVKLHFVRSLALPNLDQVKLIESECLDLPFPALPKSYFWPILFIIVGVFGFVDAPVGWAFPPGGLMAVGLGGLVLFAKIMRRNKNLRICRQSLERRDELIRQLQSLI